MLVLEGDPFGVARPEQAAVVAAQHPTELFDVFDGGRDGRDVVRREVGEFDPGRLAGGDVDADPLPVIELRHPDSR